jgi:putative ABC transport system ATP-binding protein
MSARDLFIRIRDREIIHGISVDILEKEIFTVIGPSGSGKSTFLRTLNRLVEIDKGEITLDGRDIKDLDPKVLRQRVGMVFQVPITFDGTVEDNILMGPRLTGRKPPKVEAILELVALDESFASRMASELSIGEQQRVCIGRAIANGPEVLLMDEPTSALDPASTQKIEELVLRLRENQGLTFVIVSHNMDQSRRIGERTMVIREGRGEVFVTKDLFASVSAGEGI